MTQWSPICCGGMNVSYRFFVEMLTEDVTEIFNNYSVKSTHLAAHKKKQAADQLIRDQTANILHRSTPFNSGRGGVVKLSSGLAVKSSSGLSVERACCIFIPSFLPRAPGFTDLLDSAF